ETQTIDVDINETTEVIDLCTCSIDVKDISIVSVVLQNASTSNATKERFRNLHRRLSILPSFPTKNNKQNYGDPLLPNIPPQNGTTNNGTVNNNSNHREEILNNLLRVELREAASDYLTRARRSYPIHYVFDMSDIETQQL
ncbi:unnamed protein product, partial [Rotaria sp. Silwood2]